MPLAAARLLVAMTLLALTGHVAVQGTAKDASQLNDFQLAYPVVWDAEAEDDRDRHIPVRHVHAAWRRKRSLRARPTLNINLTAFGEDFHLELWENKELLAPGFKIYRRHPRPASPPSPPSKVKVKVKSSSGGAGGEGASGREGSRSSGVEGEGPSGSEAGKASVGVGVGVRVGGGESNTSDTITEDRLNNNNNSHNNASGSVSDFLETGGGGGSGEVKVKVKDGSWQVKVKDDGRTEVDSYERTEDGEGGEGGEQSAEASLLRRPANEDPSILDVRVKLRHGRRRQDVGRREDTVVNGSQLGEKSRTWIYRVEEEEEEEVEVEVEEKRTDRSLSGQGEGEGDRRNEAIGGPRNVSDSSREDGVLERVVQMRSRRLPSDSEREVGEEEEEVEVRNQPVRNKDVNQDRRNEEEEEGGWRSAMREGAVGVQVASPEEVDLELSCLMTGRVRSHGDTPVALSLCHGMKGIIRTAGEDYIIEPVMDHVFTDADDFRQQDGDQWEGREGSRDHHLPHRVYRRSALSSSQHQGRFCGAKDQGSAERRKRSSTSGLDDQIPPPPPSSSPSSSPPPSSPSSSSSSSSPPWTALDAAVRDAGVYLRTKQHVHYVLDAETDLLVQLPPSSTTQDQLTSLQHFLLKENNDFRDSQQHAFRGSSSSSSSNNNDDNNDIENKYVPDFKFKDLKFQKPFIKNLKRRSRTNSKGAAKKTKKVVTKVSEHDDDKETLKRKDNKENSGIQYHESKENLGTDYYDDTLKYTSERNAVGGTSSDRSWTFGEHSQHGDVWPYLSNDEVDYFNASTDSREGVDNYHDDDDDEVEEEEEDEEGVDSNVAADSDVNSDDDEEDEEAGEGRGRSGRRRRRRSLTKYKYLQRGGEKTMEMLVVVDKTMMDRHGNKNVTTYTLTLFNMVSKLFQDASLGSRIRVVLVGLVLLEGDERGLSINHHADKTLNSFCSWQSVLSGARGRQHDHAVLLSATDFCSYKNSPCDTLGFAPIGGMCNQIRSCTINEDTGLNTALTIAHEIGHNFGMFHDGEGNYCRQTVGSIMAPTLVSKDGTLQWSVCSRAYLLRFLNTPQSACLDDKSQHVAELKFPDQLPGQLYDADVQCKWQFGPTAQLCQYDFGKDTCKALWCYRGNKRCETKFLPAAEGTSCGVGMWCRDGNCVRYGREGPTPVHGEWSPWAPWSTCTRTCGKGVQTRERECNRPLPQYGGMPCKTEGKQHKLCNVQACPDSPEDTHTSQCAQYDKKPFRGWYMHWKPYKKLYDAREPCKLYCLAETLNYIFTIKHVAHDGTPCSEDSAVCIEGVCQEAGCDRLINSTATTDMCGVCKGDNSSCQLISGTFSQQPKLNTYFPIVVLPKGARHIGIRETSISSNYLAIRNIYGQYYLNGERRVAWPGVYTLGGASFHYTRPYNEPETLDSSGPLGEDIILEILVQDSNPGIEYQYTIPRTQQQQVAPPADNYTWSRVVSSCSQSCAGGRMAVSAGCVKNMAVEVDARYCQADRKPKIGVFPCKTQPCPARWMPDPWSACSKTCGGGRQTRKMMCRHQVAKGRDRKLRKKLCKHLPKPATRQQCNAKECPRLSKARWVAEQWSACSKACGGGKQTRRITCRKRVTAAKERRVGKRHCKTLPKPAKRRHCHVHQCPPDWHADRWSKCSVQCGEGSQLRNVTCRVRPRHAHTTVADKHCNATTRPAPTRRCRRHHCRSMVTWRFSAWTQCSVTCGEGQQERKVWCTDGHSQHGPHRCAHLVQPPSSQPCAQPACPRAPPPQMARMSAGPMCADNEDWCYLVKQHKACGHDYYRKSCCYTCSTLR